MLETDHFLRNVKKHIGQIQLSIKTCHLVL